jgi:hypothetical protein
VDAAATPTKAIARYGFLKDIKESKGVRKTALKCNSYQCGAVLALTTFEIDTTGICLRFTCASKHPTIA